MEVPTITSHLPPVLQGFVAGVAVLGILIWSGKPPTPFFYFQF